MENRRKDYCNICNVREDYEDFFITCSAVETFWEKTVNILNTCGFKNNLKSLKTIVIGYKTANECYDDLNIVTNLIGFCIYKGYYISEKRSKLYKTIDLFIYEFNQMYAYILLRAKASSLLRNFNRLLNDNSE